MGRQPSGRAPLKITHHSAGQSLRKGLVLRQDAEEFVVCVCVLENKHLQRIQNNYNHKQASPLFTDTQQIEPG
jgi:hypothetical protein